MTPFLEMGQLRNAAALLGLEVSTLEIRQAQDALKAFEALRRRADALYVCTDAAIIHANRIQINTLAHAARAQALRALDCLGDENADRRRCVNYFT
jgi:putative ABC transport system substrate-binding protein